MEQLKITSFLKMMAFLVLFTSGNSIGQNLTTLVWKTKRDAPDKSFCTEAMNGKIYAVSCEEPNVYLQSYDPLTDEWSGKTQLLSKRYEIWSLKELNGKLYHFHGMEHVNGEERRSESVEEIDPVTNTSRLLEGKENENIRKVMTFDLDTNLPGKTNAWRWGPFKMNNKRYLLYTEPENFNSVTVFEENEQGEWIKKSAMPHTRIDATLIAVEGILYTFGGWAKHTETGPAGVSDCIESYNPKTDKWEEVGRMTEPRWGMGISFTNGKFYLFGGRDKDNQLIRKVEELEIISQQ